jgi:hypothetical protein
MCLWCRYWSCDRHGLARHGLRIVSIATGVPPADKNSKTLISLMFLRFHAIHQVRLAFV